MNSAFTGIEVSQRQFGIDGINIFCRVNTAGNVNNVIIVKAADNVADSFCFTDVGQELVTQTFTFGGAFHQTGDIDEFHGGRQNTLWFYDFRQCIQAGIRHRYHAGVRLNCTERKVRRFNTCFGQRVKQR